MKLATWNVNSLKARLDHVVQWLAQEPVDILCLQELKLRDEQFPVEAIDAAGYHALFSGQPTYNGVALLSRKEGVPLPTDIIVGNPRFEDEQKRLISARYGSMRVICAYMPNGQEVGSEKYAYKLRWYAALREWMDSLPEAELVLAGDYNVAPDDRDVHDPELWAGRILCSDAERAAMKSLQSFATRPLHDAFRLQEQAPKLFSWWDYRQLGFRRNAGLRIDHILLSDPLKARVSRCWIDKAPRKWERPSDHAPVIVELDGGDPAR